MSSQNPSRKPCPSRSLRSLVLALASAAALVGCAGVQVTKASIEHPGQLLFNGHVKPEINCYECHGGDGRGSLRGPSLAGTAKMSDARILKYINEGDGFMPAFGDKLTDDEKADIVAWLRQEFGAPSHGE